MRFLIVRLSSIGDVLHTTTVARNLKQSYPHCHITWVVSRTAAELLQYNPDIDELFIWSREDFEQAVHRGHYREAWKSIRLLRRFFSQHRFDIALDSHGLLMSGIITCLSHTPRRIGMAGTREGNRLFMNELAPPAHGPHMIDQYLSVLQPLGIKATDYHLVLHLPPALQTFPQRFFAAHGIDTTRKILLVNPNTSWPDKNWGAVNFIACLNELPGTIQILLSGGPGDKAVNEKIAAGIKQPSVDITGQTSLLELASLLQHINLLLTGDTGTLHIATALDVPTLSLWGPTRPEKYGPLVPGHTFICSENKCVNCNKTKCRLHTNDCMNAIKPQTVSQKILELLDN